MGDFSKKPSRTEYCHKEDVTIVKYLRDKDAWHLTRGNLIWQKMERAKICPNRSFHSLRNRFLRNIEKRLKTDFRHILNQDPKRRRRLNSEEESTTTSSSLSKKKVFESPTHGGHYDKPVFEEAAETVDVSLNKNDEAVVIRPSVTNEGHDKNNPVVVLKRFNINLTTEDDWLTADHQEERVPSRRKRLCSDQANNIALDGQSNEENSESIYFSVACAKNKVCLDSQENISRTDNAVAEDQSNELNTQNIPNRKSFTKNWTVTNKDASKDKECEKEQDGSDIDAFNQKSTQEVVDLTEASEVVRVSIDNQSQSSTPSNILVNSASQTDLFAINQQESEERILPSSPKSDSFLSSIKTRRQVKLISKYSHLSKSQNFNTSVFPHFHYLGLTPKNNSQAVPETSTRLPEKNSGQSNSPGASQYLTPNEKSEEPQHELSVKKTESFDVLPKPNRKTSFKMNSRMKQGTLLSRRILELHQMIRSGGVTQSKRNQRQLYSLARYILNLKGRKNIQNKTTKTVQKKDTGSEKSRQSAPSSQVNKTTPQPPTTSPIKVIKTPQSHPSTSSNQVSTRKSPRIIAGSSPQKAKMRDKPERRSILLENMLSCLEFDKRELLRKTINQ